MSSYGYIIVDLCISSFDLNCIMQLMQFYNIATTVSSRKKCYYFWWSTWLYTVRTLILLVLKELLIDKQAFSDIEAHSRHVTIMMTSSNGNIFRVTGPLCGEFPAQRPVTRSFDVFFDLRLIKRLSKHSRGAWFETLSRPSWRHCNHNLSIGIIIFPHIDSTIYRPWLTITLTCQ